MNNLRELAKKLFMPDRADYGKARYGFIRPDDSLEMSPTVICHAGLNTPPMGPFVAIVSQIMGHRADSENGRRRNGLGVEVTQEYYHWLLNESPVSQIFITKDAHQAFDDGFLILDTNHPRNAIMAACIMSRYIWEESKVPRVWFDLVNSGVDKDGAFALAHFVGAGYLPPEDPDKEFVNLTLYSENCNHTIFYGMLRLGTMTNFKNHKMTGANRRTFSQETNELTGRMNYLQNGRSVCGLFMPKGREDDPDGIEKVVVVEVGKYLNAQTKEGTSNIFWRADADARGTSHKYLDLIQAIAKVYPAICEEDEKCKAK